MNKKKNSQQSIKIGMDDFYKFYKQEYNSKVNRSLFGKIVKDFFYLLIHEIFRGFIYNMPYKLGAIGVRKYKPKIYFDENGFNFKKSNVSIDFGATNKLWRENPELKHKKYIYHTNEHTNGYKFRIKWSKKGAYVKNIGRFKFSPMRGFNRALNKYIKEHPNQQYYEF